MALGADDHYIYRENTINQLSLGQIILIGTDGIRETRNPTGEMFGSDRLATLLRQNASLSANQIIDSIFGAVLRSGTAKHKRTI